MSPAQQQPGLFPSPNPGADGSGLVDGVEATLKALDGALTDRHRGLVELIRFEAWRAGQSRGIASVNFSKQVAEHLTQLLEMVPDAAADDAGSEVTELVEYLRARRGGAPEIHDTKTS